MRTGALRHVSSELLPLYCVLAVIGLGAGLVIPLLPVMFAGAGITPSQIGILAVVMSIGAACAAVPAGRWVDRSGSRVVMAAGLLATAVVVNLFPVVHTLVAFGIVRFVEGACWALVFVAVEARLSRVSTPGTRIRNLSYYAVFNGLGFGLGPLLAVLLVRFGIWAPFAGCSLLTLLAGLSCLRLEADPVAREEKVEDDRLLGTIYRWILAAFVYGLLETGMTSMLPLFFEVTGYGQLALGITLSSFVLGGVTTPLLLGPVINRWGKRRFVILATGLAGLGAAGVPLLPGGVGPLLGLALVLGAAAGVLYVVSLSIIGDVVPAGEIGLANGFFSSSYSIGLVVGPLLSGLLFQYLGFRFFLVHVGVVGLLYFLTLLLGRAWRDTGTRLEPAPAAAGEPE